MYKSWNFHKALITTGWYGEHFQNPIPGPLQYGAPLMQEPPRTPTQEQEPDTKALRNAWMINKIYPKLNKAFAAYREQYCTNEHHLMDHFRVSRTVHPTTNCGANHISMYMPHRTGEDPENWSDAGINSNVCEEGAQEWDKSKLLELRQIHTSAAKAKGKSVPTGPSDDYKTLGDFED